MGTQGTGRKRSTKKERSTAEDDALNLIAREVSGESVKRQIKTLSVPPKTSSTAPQNLHTDRCVAKEANIY